MSYNIWATAPERYGVEPTRTQRRPYILPGVKYFRKESSPCVLSLSHGILCNGTTYILTFLFLKLPKSSRSQGSIINTAASEHALEKESISTSLEHNFDTHHVHLLHSLTDYFRQAFPRLQNKNCKWGLKMILSFQGNSITRNAHSYQNQPRLINQLHPSLPRSDYLELE